MARERSARSLGLAAALALLAHLSAVGGAAAQAAAGSAEGAASGDIAASTEAGGAATALAALRELVTYARYADADAACTAYLARTDLSAANRNAGLEMRAVILIARRRLDDARRVLSELFARDPDHRLGYRDAGPNVRDEFDRARDAGGAPLAVSLTDETVPRETRVAPEVTVAIGAGGDAIADVRLSYRVSGATGAFERTLMRFDLAEGSAVGRIPLASGREAYTLDYYVEVLAPSGAVLSSLGSAAEPRTLAVPEAPELAAPTVDPAAFAPTVVEVRGTNVAEEWWFWTILGVVVAGGVAGAVAGAYVASTPVGPQPGTLGEGRL